MTRREHIRMALAASPDVLILAFREQVPRTSHRPTPAHERRVVIDQLWDNLHDLARDFRDTLDWIDQRREELTEQAELGLAMQPEHIMHLVESLGTLTKESEDAGIVTQAR